MQKKELVPRPCLQAGRSSPSGALRWIASVGLSDVLSVCSRFLVKVLRLDVCCLQTNPSFSSLPRLLLVLAVLCPELWPAPTARGRCSMLVRARYSLRLTAE